MICADCAAQYFEWSSEIERAAAELIEQSLGRHPFVAVQWRQEFARRATHSGQCSGFSVSQCAPYVDAAASGDRGAVTERETEGQRERGTVGAAAATGVRKGAYPSELCAPSLDSMRALLEAAIKASGPSAKLFVASDTAMGELGEVGELFAELGAVTQAGGTYTHHARARTHARTPLKFGKGVNDHLMH